MNAKQKVQELLDKQAKEVINKLPESFDSHDFIQMLIKVDEKGYVETLSGFISSSNGIFRSFHSQIGIYLSSERNSLNIESKGKVSSENIKDYFSDNEKWVKNKVK